MEKVNDTEQQYLIKFVDIEETQTVDATRLIEYANHRFEANPEDREEFSFDTYNITVKQAIQVIESYDEEVEVL